MHLSHLIAARADSWCLALMHKHVEVPGSIPCLVQTFGIGTALLAVSTSGQACGAAGGLRTSQDLTATRANLSLVGEQVLPRLSASSTSFIEDECSLFLFLVPTLLCPGSGGPSTPPSLIPRQPVPDQRALSTTNPSCLLSLAFLSSAKTPISASCSLGTYFCLEF